MRRKDKEIADKKHIEEIVEKAMVCRVSLSDEGEPYMFPVNYGYSEGCLYFHSACQGKKIEMMQKNPRVCFQMDIDVELVPTEKGCDWSIKYKSVIGFGKAVFLHSPEEKKHALKKILSHYSDQEYTFSEDSLASVCIICIHIEKMTGKKSGY
jgi:nitroimidazol reductase NimA-like FMN-containing flavoprotein (pyridoxamine 5'-phosphate oxidase superfamily)